MSFELEPDEVPTVSGDPDYDDDWRFLPFVREHGRDVPYRLSEHYEKHKRSWGRLPIRQQIGDLKRLLPTLQALRKPGAQEGDQHPVSRLATNRRVAFHGRRHVAALRAAVP